MQPTAAVSSPDRLSDSQRAALISLLADDDPAVYSSVQQKLLSYGPAAHEWLRPYLLSSDPVLRRRASKIVQQCGRQIADNRFLAFCLKQGEDLDLEQGAWLLAQTQYPDANLEAYRALLDDFAGELRERIVFAPGARGILAAANDFIFGELHFSGNEQNYYEPENSYLNMVVDRRKGNPISLCLVYILLARRLYLPVTGIGLPGHFICRFQTSCEEIYIDCFNHGRLMTKADCIHYLVRGNYDVQDEYLSPLTPRRMLMRMCGNLHRIYFHLQLRDETTRLQRYLVALAR